MLAYLSIIVTTILVNNIVFAQFLGICPFLGVSRKLSSAVGMGAAVLFVMLFATCVTWLMQNLVLVPLGIEYTQTIVFILIIAALVQMLEIVLKKSVPALYQALGVFLPLITTNCAVLGVAIIVTQKGLGLAQSLIYSVGTALGFMLALVIFTGIREQLTFVETPKAMSGVPIALICAGILAMAFMGFSGISIG